MGTRSKDYSGDDHENNDEDDDGGDDVIDDDQLGDDFVSGSQSSHPLLRIFKRKMSSTHLKG